MKSRRGGRRTDRRRLTPEHEGRLQPLLSTYMVRPNEELDPVGKADRPLNPILRSEKNHSGNLGKDNGTDGITPWEGWEEDTVGPRDQKREIGALGPVQERTGQTAN